MNSLKGESQGSSNAIDFGVPASQEKSQRTWESKKNRKKDSGSIVDCPVRIKDTTIIVSSSEMDRQQQKLLMPQGEQLTRGHLPYS